MAIYFIQILAIVAVGATCNVNKSDRAKKRFLFFAFGLLILVAALRSVNVGTDLATHYAKRYVQIASYGWNQIPEFSAMSTYELGYCYLTKFLSSICPHVQFYIAVTSLFTYGVTARFIYKNSCNVKMSTYVFVLTCTYYNYMNIVRQAIAISIILLGYEFLKKPTDKIKNYTIFTIFVLAASTIHSSAILCLLLIMFKELDFKRKHIFIGVVCTIAFYLMYQQIFNLVLNIFGLSGEYAGYLTKEAESVGHINKQSIFMLVTIALAFVIGCITLVIERKLNSRADEESMSEEYWLSDNESFLLYTGLLATVCRLMVFRMNIINRYSYYFLPFVLLLYPMSICNCKLRSNRRVVKWAVYIILGIYYVWMTVAYEASFHRTVPYEAFWQCNNGFFY